MTNSKETFSLVVSFATEGGFGEGCGGGADAASDASCAGGRILCIKIIGFGKIALQPYHFKTPFNQSLCGGIDRSILVVVDKSFEEMQELVSFVMRCMP